MERRWRFVYDEKSAGQWAWQVHENMRVKIASLRAFATLDGCIDHARASGFSFAQKLRHRLPAGDRVKRAKPAASRDGAAVSPCHRRGISERALCLASIS